MTLSLVEIIDIFCPHFVQILQSNNYASHCFAVKASLHVC